MPLPKKYKKKYARKYSQPEEVTFFAFKVVVPTVLSLLLALGFDVYRLFT